MTHRPTLSSTIFLTLAALSLLPRFNSEASTISANVSVTPAATIGTIPATAMGINTAIWDYYLTDSNTASLLEQAGIDVLRYPGGSASDGYHWATNLNENPASFDPFMTTVSQPIGASQIITVNYGSNETNTGGGDPNEAAAWVQYANITKGYGIKYWEIGNEVYGSWEEDLWPSADDAATNPTFYGQEVVQYVNAMKAVDPTIKIGVVLALPGQEDSWNNAVLAQCGTKIDFVIIHWYPEYNNPPYSYDNDAALLADPEQIAGFIADAKSQIANNCGANASNVKIFVTETNSDPGTPGKQMLSTVQALFMSDNIQTWLENGVTNVDYWDLRNGAGNGDEDPTLFGTLLYGDEGALSNGSSVELNNGTIATEPAVDTPFCTYYAMQMDHYLGKPGDTMVTSASDQSLLSTHAVVRADGSLGVLVINKDPSNTYNVALNVASLHSASTSTITYGPDTATNQLNSYDSAQVDDITLPPYTMETVSFGAGHTFSPGLQMIALPYDFTGIAPSATIMPTTPMAAWDPTTDTYGVAPTAPADAFRSGIGYWVRVPQSYSSLVATGGTSPSATTTINLATGWNMIGDPYSSAIPPADMSIQASGQASVTFLQAVTNNLIGSTLYTYPEGASAYTPVLPSNGLQPYLGYWIYSDGSATLTFTQPS